MFKNLYTSTIFIGALLFTIVADAQNNSVVYTVNEIYKSDTVFRVPESVLYDKTNHVLYVSNIDGKSSELDGKGFISKVATDGTLLQLNWISGLDAPKGMGIVGKNLYVTNINELVEIDTNTQAIANRYPLPGSKFLNDIDTDPETGNVYVSDMGSNKVYSFRNGVYTLIVTKDSLTRPNGLYFSNNTLYIGQSGSIVAYNTITTESKILINNTGGIDGLEPINEGEFIISDWAGKIQIVGKNAQVLSDTSPQKVNAADIEYISELQIIAVPNFFNNTITFYKLTQVLQK